MKTRETVLASLRDLRNAISSSWHTSATFLVSIHHRPAPRPRPSGDEGARETEHLKPAANSRDKDHGGSQRSLEGGGGAMRFALDAAALLLFFSLTTRDLGGVLGFSSFQHYLLAFMILSSSNKPYGTIMAIVQQKECERTCRVLGTGTR